MRDRPDTGTVTTPKWTRLDRLWPKVPWLWPSDFDDGPKAAWDVEYAVDQDKASCWEIQIYASAKSTRAYLMLHAVRGNGNDGGDISLAISDSPRYDIYAKGSFAAVPAQQTQRRGKRHVFRSRWDLE